VSKIKGPCGLQLASLKTGHYPNLTTLLGIELRTGKSALHGCTEELRELRLEDDLGYRLIGRVGDADGDVFYPHGVCDFFGFAF